MIRPLALAAALLSIGALPALAAGPAPPAGTDPGGIAVALVGSGIDYRDPSIARRLARDGEGDMIGRDLTTNDGRPFRADDPGTQRDGVADSTTLARLFAPSAPYRLIPVRAATDDLSALARAIAFAAQTPARIIVLPVTALNGPQGELVRQAAQRYRTLLFIVALAEEADGAPLPTPSSTGAVPTLRTENLLLVSPAVDSKAEPHNAELMVEVPAGLTPPLRLAHAIAQTVSAATCVLAPNSSATAREVKAALLARGDQTKATGGRRALASGCPGT